MIRRRELVLSNGTIRCGPSPRWMSIDNESDQVSYGHLVDALALRGDEGRTTLR